MRDLEEPPIIDNKIMLDEFHKIFAAMTLLRNQQSIVRYNGFSEELIDKAVLSLGFAYAKTDTQNSTLIVFHSSRNADVNGRGRSSFRMFYYQLSSQILREVMALSKDRPEILIMLYKKFTNGIGEMNHPPKEANGFLTMDCNQIPDDIFNGMTQQKTTFSIEMIETQINTLFGTKLVRTPKEVFKTEVKPICELGEFVSLKINREQTEARLS